MEMKYEPVFGDQSLFDGCYDENASVVIATSTGRKFVAGEFTEYGIVDGEVKSDGLRIAMRRIIRTPTWSIADQKAGRLPAVGVKCIWVDLSDTESPDDFLYPEVDTEIEIVANTKTSDGKYPVSVFKWLHDDGETQCYAASGHVEDFKPIESPEEKAARLREEWCESALKIINHKFIDARGPMAIYDALLTGDLPVPVKEQP